MSTNTGYGSLYRGEGKLHEELRRMVVQGKNIAREEKARWQANRLYYRGDARIEARPSPRSSAALAHSKQREMTRESFNRLRQMTDGRVAMLTTERPAIEAIPTSREQVSIDASRQTTKVIAAKWGDWGVDRFRVTLTTTGEIDGVSFANVVFDPAKGDPIPVSYDRATGQPITDMATLKAFQQEDPTGDSLWERRDAPMGDVVFRVVRPGALSIDPVPDKWEDVRWVIETRVWSKDEFERRAGKKLETLVKQSDSTTGTQTQDREMNHPVALSSDDGEPDALVPGRDRVIVHEAFMLKGPRFPKGLHCVWADKAPAAPIVSEPWDDTELPYMPFTPKPDGGHFLRCRGTVDELRPIQRSFDRTLRLVRQWLERVARPPVMVPVGAIRGQELYNEQGFVEYHPIGEPHLFPTPSEPAAILTQHLQWCIQQMSEIANQTDVVRGVAPGMGAESAVALQSLAQNTETQLSGPAAQQVKVLEWALTRAIKLVQRHYVVPRLIQTAGVDQGVELRAFVGEQLRGVSKVRVDGSILPKSKALQMQTLMQLVPLVGDAVRPYIGRFVEGSLDEFLSAEESQRNKQKRENESLAMLGSIKNRDIIWQDFQAELMRYMKLVQEVNAQIAATPMPSIPDLPSQQQRPDPMQQLQAMGIQQPSIIGMLRDAGVQVPMPEDFDDGPQHLSVLNGWRLTEGFERMHPIVQQAAREHAQAHLQRTTQNLVAQGAMIGQPQPSQPNPKGQPSPPKQKGAPGGQPGVATTTGASA